VSVTALVTLYREFEFNGQHSVQVIYDSVSVFGFFD
jgi:hypothetical protein